MTGDIRAARFYIIDETVSSLVSDAAPLEFEEALETAQKLIGRGAHVRVLYTEEATQIEITRLVSHGIQTELVSGA